MRFATLRDAGVSVLDCEHKTPSPQSSGNPYIAIPDIHDGYVDTKTARKITSEDYAEWTRRTKPVKGDVVVTRRARVGDTGRIPSSDCAIGQNLVILRSSGVECRQDYLYWSTRSPKWSSEVDRYLNVGAVFSSLNVSDIGSIEIPLPPLPEQRAIAEVLGALDDKIAANRKLVTTSLNLAEAVHDLALSDEQRPLGDFMEFAYGKSLPATRRIPGEVPVVGSGGVTGSHDEALVNRPGIVVGRKGSMGTVRWMDGPFFPIDTTFYVTNRTEIPDQFWYFSLKQARFEGLNSDSAVPGLNREAALDQMTRVPSEDGIKRFEDVALPLFELARINRRESQTLAQLRDTLLPALMDGTIRVKDAQNLTEEAV